MPFKSESQRRFMFAKKPAIAKEFASMTPKGTKLPEKVKKKNNPGVLGNFKLKKIPGVPNGTGPYGRGLGPGMGRADGTGLKRGVKK